MYDNLTGMSFEEPQPEDKMDPRLVNESPKKVGQLYDNGQVRDSHLNEYLFKKKMEKGGLHTLEPDEVAWGQDNGHLTDEQVGRYVDRKESFTKFYAKETWLGMSRIPGRITRNLFNTIMDAGDMLGITPEMGYTTMGLDAPQDMGNGKLADARFKSDELGILKNAPTTSGYGDFVTAGGAMAAEFIPAYGMVKKGTSTLTILQAARHGGEAGKTLLTEMAAKGMIHKGLAEFAIRNPRTANLLVEGIQQGMAGAAVDFTQDIDEGRMVDHIIAMSDEAPWTKNALFDYLKSQPGDERATARFKNVLEGGLFGVALSPVVNGIFGLARAAKYGTWQKAGFDKGKVVEILEEATERASKNIPDPELPKPAKLETTVVAPKVDPLVGQKVRASDMGNIGKVLNVDNDAGTASVKFTNPDTGATVTKTMSLEQLESLDGQLLKRSEPQSNLRSDAKPGKAADGGDGLEKLRVYTSEAEAKEEWETLITPEMRSQLELFQDPNNGHIWTLAHKGFSAEQNILTPGKQSKAEAKSLYGVKKPKLNEVLDDAMAVIKGEKGVDEATPALRNWRYFDGGEDLMRARDMLADQLTTTKWGNVAKHKSRDSMLKQALDNLGMNLKDLPKRAARMNAEMAKLENELLATDLMMTRYSAQISAMAKEALETKNAGMLAEVREHIFTLGDMDINMRGVTAGWGRMGNSLQMIRRANDLGSYDAMVMKGNPDGFSRTATAEGDEVIAKQFLEAKNQKARNQLARTVQAKHPVLAALLELRQSALVSGISTNIWNVTGQAAATVFEMGLKASVGVVKGLQMGDVEYIKQWFHTIHRGGIEGFFKATGLDTETLKDSGKLWTALKASNAGRTARTGVSTIDPTAVLEGAPVGGWRASFDRLAEKTGQDNLSKLGNAVQKYMVDVPFKPLAVADEFFRTVNFYSELSARTFDKAWNEGLAKGLKGADLHKYVNEVSERMMKDPPVDVTGKAITSLEELYARAEARGLEHGYTGKDLEQYAAAEAKGNRQLVNDAVLRSREVTMNSSLPPKLQSAMSWLGDSKPGMLMRIFTMPFVKVPFNIAKYATEASPLWRFSSTYSKLEGYEKAHAIAKMTAGSTLMAAGAMLYAGNSLTSTTLPAETRARQAAKVVGDSIVIGDRQFPINRFAPVALMLVIGADLARFTMDGVFDDATEVDDLIKMLPLLAAPILSQVPLKDIANITEAVMGNEQITQDVILRGVGRQVKTFMPYSGLISGIEGMFDDKMREITGPLDGVLGAYWRFALPERRHSVYGTALDEAPGAIYKTPDLDDKEMLEVLRVGSTATPMNRKLGNTKMEPEEYRKLQSILAETTHNGKTMKDALRDLHSSKKYVEGAGNDDQLRREMNNDVISGYRGKALNRFLKETVEGQAVAARERGDLTSRKEARKGGAAYRNQNYSGNTREVNAILNQ